MVMGYIQFAYVHPHKNAYTHWTRSITELWDSSQISNGRVVRPCLSIGTFLLMKLYVYCFLLSYRCTSNRKVRETMAFALPGLILTTLLPTYPRSLYESGEKGFWGGGSLGLEVPKLQRTGLICTLYLYLLRDLTEAVTLENAGLQMKSTRSEYAL